MKRKLFGPEHELFRDAFRTFLEREVVPHHAQWEEAGMVPREIWRKAGEQGFLCPWAKEAYGGQEADFLFSAVIAEETAAAGASGITFNLHSDIVAPYVANYGSEEQKQRFLTRAVSGDAVMAIAMTEPNTGSDLSAIRTTAIKEGDHYILNGQKTFITNGGSADVVIVAAKTDPSADPPHAGVSLLLVEAGTPGFEKGKLLKKIGLKAQDTYELYFEDCKVPTANLLGSEGAGFYALMQELAQERLILAVATLAEAKRVFDMTVAYTKERKAFGRSISRFQNTRFALAEIATEIELGEAFLDRVLEAHISGQSVPTEASMAKWWITEMNKRNVDRCLQFFGGYGFMEEYPISQAYINARVQTIYAGTTEIMKEIISRNLGL